MIKQCSECPNTYESGRGLARNAGAKTCSDECSKARRKRKMDEWLHNNPNYHRVWQNAWRKANPLKKREKDRKYRQENKAKHNENNRKRYHRMGGDDGRRFIPQMRARDGDNCTWCGLPIDFTKPFDVDHWKPVAHGGKTELDNLSCQHCHCNRAKSDQWPLPSPPWEGKAATTVQLSLFD